MTTDNTTFFVLLSVATDKLYRKPGHFTEMRYKTAAAAKAAATRLNKKAGKTQFLWYNINDYLIYRGPVKMVERTNLMSGQKYMEAEDTPRCCSPSSELYWTM